MQELFSNLSHAVEGSPMIALAAAVAWGILCIVLTRAFRPDRHEAQGTAGGLHSRAGVRRGIAALHVHCNILLR
jgi:hypothetical protein